MYKKKTVTAMGALLLDLHFLYAWNSKPSKLKNLILAMSLDRGTSPSSSCSPPPWEVLPLVSPHMDAETLAIASCVCKAWFAAMSADHIWGPICAVEYPSLAALPAADAPRRKIYSLGRAAVKSRLRQAPAKPRLSLDDLAFAVTVNSESGTLVSLLKPCWDLATDPDGVFLFDLGPGVSPVPPRVPAGPEEVRVVWSVVLREWRGLFTAMEWGGKMGVAAGGEGWVSAELPTPGCCAAVAAAGSGVAADLKVGFGAGVGGRVAVERVTVGLLNVVSWRYLTVNDGLRYLQHFLLENDSFFEGSFAACGDRTHDPKVVWNYH